MWPEGNEWRDAFDKTMAVMRSLGPDGLRLLDDECIQHAVWYAKAHNVFVHQGMLHREQNRRWDAVVSRHFSHLEKGD
jgi:hypothetical protein